MKPSGYFHNWLVVLTILKNMKVNGKDDIPYIIYESSCSKTPHFVTLCDARSVSETLPVLGGVTYIPKEVRTGTGNEGCRSA